MTERWLPILGFEGLYSVSDHGNVRSENRPRVVGRVLTPSSAGKGYRKVTLRSRPHVSRYVHELVLGAFVGPRPAGQEAAHRNGKRDDNRLRNLRWDTRAGNHSDKRAHGTLCRGESHGRSKLSADNVRDIRAASGTLQEIGARFGVGPMQVHRIKKLENWSHIR